MFLLKEFLSAIILPPTIWLVLLFGVVLFWKRKWARKLLLATSLLVLILHSGLTAQFLGYFLESRFKPLRDCRTAAPYDAIVVLMSSATRAHGLIPYDTIDHRTFGRLDEAWRLYRCDPKPIIVSGGPADPFERAEDENRILCDYLIRWGVPEDRIIQENKSRDTFENALEVGKILKQRDWHRYLLVTSAIHMPRSMLAFRAVAPEPIAAPGDFRVGGLSLSPLNLFPKEDAAENVYAALHEYIGLINYRWRVSRVSAPQP